MPSAHAVAGFNAWGLRASRRGKRWRTSHAAPTTARTKDSASSFMPLRNDADCSNVRSACRPSGVVAAFVRFVCPGRRRVRPRRQLLEAFGFVVGVGAERKNKVSRSEKGESPTWSACGNEKKTSSMPMPACRHADEAAGSLLRSTSLVFVRAS